MSESIEGLIGSAKAHRNAASPRYSSAASDLRKAIGLLEAKLKAEPASSRRTAATLADSYGMLGGVERRWWRQLQEEAQQDEDQSRSSADQKQASTLIAGAQKKRGEAAQHLEAALEAYVLGRKIEQDPQYAIVDSHCLVNAIVIALLIDPRTIDKEALAKAEDTITDQVDPVDGPRRDRWWAWGDLALCRLLLGKWDQAERAYRRFKNTGARPGDYESTILVLQDLEKRLFEAGDKPTSESIRKGIEYLDQSKLIPRSMCFVAMPFGKKEPPGGGTAIDFDTVYDAIQRAVVSEGIDCHRADFEVGGGFIHRPMFERLLVAEYVIADLTFANANVAYEVGIRHGASVGATFLICEASFVNKLPFDFRPLRVLGYDVKDGKITPESRRSLSEALAKQFALTRTRSLPLDNPLLQLARAEHPNQRVGHEKTDVFLARARFLEKYGEKIAKALAEQSITEAQEELAAIESELANAAAGDHDIRERSSVLMSVFIGYREKKAYERMVKLYDNGELFKPELKNTAVAREQVALALNRLAEASAKRGEREQADKLRARALLELQPILTAAPTSETYGIVGRIHKATYREERDAVAGAPDRALRAETALARAIDAYEQGFRLDPRDFYPGVNAVTLRAVRGGSGDEDAVKQLAPVVVFAIARAPETKNPQERYWRRATLLEVALLVRDWTEADKQLGQLLTLPAEAYMRETTADNLRLLADARPSDRARLEKFIAALLAPPG